MLTELLLIPFLVGIIFIIVSMIMLKFPPKKINFWYGYRTPNSMKSQERWDFSQEYSAVEMRKMGVIMLVISFAGFLLPVDMLVKTAIGMAIMFGAIIYMFRRVETAIKTRFGND